MSKNENDFKLDLISQISPDLVEKAANKRYELVKKTISAKHSSLSRKILSYVLVATLVLAFNAAVIFFGFIITQDSKQIPVYEGMTVSDSLQSSGLLEHSNNRIELKLLANQTNESYKTELSDMLNGQKNMFDIPEQQSMYYALPSQDIYITVHLSNPDNYEILSFTLNGVKYSSYMFEDGSDMENLILKCNVGDVAGIIEYSIDAVKYVDGEAIKDARMEGDRTVSVAVYTEEQPTATINNIFASFDTVTFTALSQDSFGLINKFGGKLYAVLHDNDEIVRMQEIICNTKQQITWTGLSKNTNYRCAIVGVYDALDGSGADIHILADVQFSTADIFAFSDIEIGYDFVSFNPKWDDSYKGERKLHSLALYDAQIKICELATDITEIKDLLTDHTYRIVAVYINDGKQESVEQEITTLAYQTPEISIHNSSWSEDKVQFGVLINDPDKTGLLSKIELLDDRGNLLQTALPDVRRFDNLECPKTYIVRATYAYDLRNGNGECVLETSRKIVTQSKGLNVRNGVVTGIGSCTEKEIFINMPVENGAFVNSDITRVEFGSNVTLIGGGAFMRCEQLEEIVFADGLKTIELKAFSGSPVERPVFIPSSVEMIDANAIETGEAVAIYCAVSEKPEGWHKSWISGQENVVWGLKGFYSDDQGLTYATLTDESSVVIYFDNSSDTIVLPDGVVSINSFVFRESNIKSIEFPGSLQVIKEQAFAHCTKLETIILNEGLTSLENYAFAYCEKLKKAVIPSSIQEIGSNIFLYCRSLTDITLPDTMTYIPDTFLACCESLVSVKIPSNVTSIGCASFNGCDMLSEVILPEGLQTIEQEAFSACPSLKEIVIPESVVKIEWYAFDGHSNIMNIYLKADRPSAKFNLNWRDFDTTTLYCGFTEWYVDENGIRYAYFKDGSKIRVE